MKTLTDSDGLRTLGFGFRMIDILKANTTDTRDAHSRRDTQYRDR
jgi:hypothetical protein